GAARAGLRAGGVDDANVSVVSGTPTGVALIAVDRGGQNQISVAPGANRDLGDPTEALEGSRPALVLASCEIPFAALSAAAAWCGTNQVAFVLNPAPTHPILRELLDPTRVVTANHG